MVDELRGIARVAAMPLVWAFGFLITSMEVPSAFLSVPPGSMAAAGIGLQGGVAPEICSAVVYGAVFVFAPRIGSLVRQGWLVPMALALAVLGLLIRYAPGQAVLNPATVLAGMVSMQVGFAALLLVGLELLAAMVSQDARAVVIGGSLVNALAVVLSEIAPLAGTFASLILGAIALLVARRALPSCGQNVPEVAGLRAMRGAFILMMGLLVVVASFGFLQALLYQQDMASVSSVVSGTKFAAVAVFAIVLARVGDTSYATLGRIIVTLAVAAFLVFLAQGSYSLLPSVVMNTGYSLLEMTTLVIAAELASATRLRPLRLFASIYLIESVGYIFGCLTASASLGLGAFGLRLGAVVLALALVVCAIWVFTEKRVNEFLWCLSERGGDEGKIEAVGGGETKTLSGGETAEFEEGDALPAWEEGAYGRKVAAVAERYRLSPREAEVLALFAAGRSAVFIAELQFVTTNTVRSHIKHIYSKCDVHSRQELITLVEHQEITRGCLPEDL